MQGHLIGKRPVNSTRATALERFEAEFCALTGAGVALAVKFPKSKRLAKR